MATGGAFGPAAHPSSRPELTRYPPVIFDDNHAYPRQVNIKSVCAMDFIISTFTLAALFTVGIAEPDNVTFFPNTNQTSKVSK